MKKKKKIIIATMISILSIGLILYGLADRYLIQHVEVTNVSQIQQIPATDNVFNETTGQQLIDAGVVNTYSFGPGLITEGTIVEGIDSVEIDTNFGNHSIQGNQPRSAIGMVSANHFIFIVVDGRSDGYSNGMSLSELVTLF